MKIPHLSFLLALIIAGSFACKSREQKDNAVTEKTEVVENKSETTETTREVVSSAAVVEIKSGNDVVASLRPGGQEVEISFGGSTLKGHLKGEKCKYELDGKLVAEVKYSDDGFKVRTPEGNLLWKIKIYDDKIKISDNEENNNPFEIRESNSEKIKVKREDREVATARLDGNKIEIESNDESLKFSVGGTLLQKAYAVAAIREIPERERWIIMHELLKKNPAGN